jgi:hypothetical protein
MLAAMRWVSTRPEHEDVTHQQGEMRKWLREDRKGFMGHRAGLEGKALAGRSPSGTVGSGTSSVARDPARERVKLLLEKEFELVRFAKENRELILEYMAKREAFLAWEAERAAAAAG